MSKPCFEMRAPFAPARTGVEDLLRAVADGRWYTRPALKARFAGVPDLPGRRRDYDWLKATLQKCYRKGWLEKVENPGFDPAMDSRAQAKALMGASGGPQVAFGCIAGGNTAARYLYRLTDAGSDELEWRKENGRRYGGHPKKAGGLRAG